MNVTFTKVQNDWLEASFKDDDGKELAFVSYHPTQLDLIRADAAKHGADLAEHEAMLAEWVAGYVPPPPPPVPVPQKVTAFQAKAALLHANLLDAVEAMMAHADTPRIVKLAWLETLHFERTSPTVAAMAAALKLSAADVDQLFIYASEVEA